MSPVKHAAASGIVGAILAYLSQSIAGGMACFLSGIFIDIDHAYDFWCGKRKFFFTYDEMDDFFTKFPEAARIYVILHSFELVVLLWGIWLLDLSNMILLGVNLGVTLHIAMDFVGNPLRHTGYFLLYRIKHRFKKEDIFVEGYFDDKT